jgi:hypothetical protein
VTEGLAQDRGDLGRRATTAGLAALMALGAWPWLAGLALAPVTKDGAMWIARGSLANPDWFRWVFLTSHFNVGYRPLTAFSYTVLSAVAGLDPWLYRLTDLVLHLWVGLSIYLLWRVLAREAPRWGGLVATALFFAHPLVQQVVPFIPRRSYSLAATLTQAGLLVLLVGVRRSGAARVMSVRTVIAGLLLAGALLANEAAVMAMLILPLLVFHLVAGRGPAVATIARACAVPWGLVILALGSRSLVLGGLGGYARESDGGALMVKTLLRGWHDLGSLAGPGGGAAGLALLPAGGLLLLAIAVYYLYRSLGEPLLDRSSPGGRLTLVLAAWTLSYMLLYGALGVWFPRQSYLLLIPLCLLLALIFQRTVAVRTFPGTLLQLLPQVLLAGHLVMVSPVVLGPDEVRVGLWEQRSGRLQAMEQGIGAATAPATVWLVQPYVEVENRPLRRTGAPSVGGGGLRRGDAQPAIWMNAIFQARDIQVRDFLYYEVIPGASGGVPVYDAGGGRPALRLAPDRRHHLSTGIGEQFESLPSAAGQAIPLQWADLPAGRQIYLYVQDPEDGGRLIPVPRDRTPEIP